MKKELVEAMVKKTQGEINGTGIVVNNYGNCVVGVLYNFEKL